ncbi:phosphatidate cytidylyltransferase [Flavobacteria bacterium MS024-3C]|jgi:phosphatidate cytidylyltransferase|nr:phosphatidate cytidylyltransferase [Flavobacteria bacterium MS024-3C]KRO81595.1 MAG: phosphatidate cytidylyltransferase [Polaribacter sp. BACL8 MAG-120531-bin13]KRP03298.1 MAG: phosphatidate cytidylyltransferase [Polaribacter sp. BACL8 MAG-120619-bin41]MBT4839176.1 phosphatidate cytidylyltransferase [Flavobacteriaceae bacterium]MBT5394336.1 phosphatidate cytidylyltransferase [Flavobacteriaceae bacterium]|tara:strand:- start:6374 stop:7168 length:795 start_codon:yes stop_codon:yes gene_type:complete
MRELIRRLLTGGVYVFILLAAVFLNSDAFDFLFMAFGLACIYEYKRITKLRGYYLFMAYLALWWLFIYLIQNKFTIALLLGATIGINIFLLTYLLSKKKQKLPKSMTFISGVFYIGGGCIFLTLIPYTTPEFAKMLITGIFLIIWMNDSFAYLIGKQFGKNKLYPSVSPKKTVEGAIGGLVFGLLAAVLIAQIDPLLSLYQWLLLATVVVITGNLGDLLESKFKRVAGVKDSGAILPGHGGMLDRLDSLIFAAPFAYLLIIIFN